VLQERDQRRSNRGKLRRRDVHEVDFFTRNRINVASVTADYFFSSRRRHTISVSAFLLNRSSDLGKKFRVGIKSNISTNRNNLISGVDRCIHLNAMKKTTITSINRQTIKI